MSTERTLRQRVARGAAFLDEREPGWHRKVHLRELKMWSSCECVVGQLDGRFWATVYRWHPEFDRGLRNNRPEAWVLRHGFWTTEGGDYGVLDALWREAIRQRRSVSTQGIQQ